MRALRGVPTEPGVESPFRNRSVEENLDLFNRMKAGEFEEGSKVLRAKIDMSSPNMHLRDPAMYRILKATHHRTGDKWNIYPMYDYAHGICDSIEHITHSLCTIEFEVHRPLYDWFLDALDLYHPQQIEFAPLNLNYTVLSKRKLIHLVESGLVAGWDDPRLPTITGMKRRGYTPKSIQQFIEKAGIAKRESITEMELLEYCVREDLNKVAPRVMAVLNPLKVTIKNYPDGKVEEMVAINNPEDTSGKTRIIPFSKTIYIEREDFMEDAPKKYFRLAPGKDVRLKNAYIIHCEEVIKDEAGEIHELICTYYPDSKSGSDTSGVKVKGVIHWVSVEHALPARVRLYDRLFDVEEPDGQKDGSTYLDHINPASLEIIEKVFVEPSLKAAIAFDQFQFMRKGYFNLDPDSTADQLIFNRTVPMRDSWAKKQKQK
ncbi:UNVERIFIED_CONTAM: hypothetical protein GTU68_052797 [Idotea baltica]|nr:hypothetical protein [Idotea baltica]